MLGRDWLIRIAACASGMDCEGLIPKYMYARSLLRLVSVTEGQLLQRTLQAEDALLENFIDDLISYVLNTDVTSLLSKLYGCNGGIWDEI